MSIRKKCLVHKQSMTVVTLVQELAGLVMIKSTAIISHLSLPQLIWRTLFFTVLLRMKKDLC